MIILLGDAGIVQRNVHKGMTYVQHTWMKEKCRTFDYETRHVFFDANVITQPLARLKAVRLAKNIGFLVIRMNLQENRVYMDWVLNEKWFKIKYQKPIGIQVLIVNNKSLPMLFNIKTLCLIVNLPFWMNLCNSAMLRVISPKQKSVCE